jgi:hypothetical protein
LFVFVLDYIRYCLWTNPMISYIMRRNVIVLLWYRQESFLCSMNWGERWLLAMLIFCRIGDHYYSSNLLFIITCCFTISGRSVSAWEIIQQLQLIHWINNKYYLYLWMKWNIWITFWYRICKFEEDACSVDMIYHNWNPEGTMQKLTDNTQILNKRTMVWITRTNT